MVESALSPFVQVRSTRAHECIVKQLQELILSGKLAAGAHLPSEREMMTEFQVSRPTVREALRVAESMGLISVRAGDPAGPKVLGAPAVGITRVLNSLLDAGCASALELLELRMVLDASSAARASMQPRRYHAKLGEILNQMRETTDPGRFAELDVSFHEAVIVAGGNRLFILVCKALDQPIRTLIESTLKASLPQRREETLKHHGAIVDAIKRGDAKGAARAARSHLLDFYYPGMSDQEKSRIQLFVHAMERMG